MTKSSSLDSRISSGDTDILASTFGQTDEAIFTANLKDITSMSKILHELEHINDHFILVIDRSGIKLITTTDEKTVQVSAYFSSDTFQRFEFNHANHDQVINKFLLKDFIQCLNLLRDDPVIDGDENYYLNQQHTNEPYQPITTSLYIQYRKKDDPLRLKLEKHTSYVIDCELKALTVEDESLSLLGFDIADDTAVILLYSRRFYEYVGGLDFQESEFVELIMGSGETPIKMSTKSTKYGEVEVEITERASDIIKEPIQVSNNTLFSFAYNAKSIKLAFEALKYSALVQIKCGSSGLLCIEHFHSTERLLVPVGPGLEVGPDDGSQVTSKRSSVEYLILSVVSKDVA